MVNKGCVPFYLQKQVVDRFGWQVASQYLVKQNSSRAENDFPLASNQFIFPKYQNTYMCIYSNTYFKIDVNLGQEMKLL